MGKLPAKLQSKLAERSANNSLRGLSSNSGLIDFSSNDYLGFSREEVIQNGALNLLHEMAIHGSGATGSRLLTGNHPMYGQLESFLIHHHSAEAALVFNSGYDANIGFFASVPQRGDLVFYDELIHASIRDGIKMGNAKSYKFVHNDLDQLKNRLEASFRAQSKNAESEIYIVTESVFSMDGDSPDLTAFAQFCMENGYYLVVDEAHATGIYGGGRDLVCGLGLEGQVFARIITFGKALGCHGAAILGSEALKTYLVNFARSLIFTTALSPHSLATILSAYQSMQQIAGKFHAALEQNIKHFKGEVEKLGLKNQFIHSDSAIHCLVVSGNQRVKELSNALKQEEFDVKPILSPTVKEGRERLRFCLHAFNTQEEISRVLHLVKNGIKK